MNNNVVDEKIYNEMDNLASEVFDGEGLVKYITARREAFTNPEEAVKKYLDEDVTMDMINSYGDFYYYYMVKYSNCFFYKFNQKGYTKEFKKLLERNGVNPELLNINWESIEAKENKYQEALIDILYAMINYELKKLNLSIFGVNIGYETILYYVTSEKAYERIVESQKLIKIFDIQFLEEIYNEIFEITGDFGIEGIEKGDFLEKNENSYRTLFEEQDKNLILNGINEENENQVRIIL